MTGRTLAALALKVFGIMLVVAGLTAMPSTALFVLAPARNAQGAMVRASKIGMIASVVFRIAIGAAPIGVSDRVARWAVPETPPLGVDLDFVYLTDSAFALAGLFILVAGLEDAAVGLFTLATKPSWPPGQQALTCTLERQHDPIVRGGVQIVAGSLLVLGRRGVVDNRLRLGGRAPEDESAPDDTPSELEEPRQRSES